MEGLEERRKRPERCERRQSGRCTGTATVEPDAAPTCVRGGLGVYPQVVADIQAVVCRTVVLRGPEDRRVGFGAPRILCGEYESKVLRDTQNLHLLELLRLTAVTDHAELMSAECAQASGYVAECTPVIPVRPR